MPGLFSFLSIISFDINFVLLCVRTVPLHEESTNVTVAEKKDEIVSIKDVMSYIGCFN